MFVSCPASGLHLSPSHDYFLQYASFSPIIQDSVKCYTFQASCPDLSQVEGTFSFPELTNT